MKSANITDVSEALQKLADHNSLDINEMCVVIESGDTLYEVLEEARKVKSPLYKTKIKNVKSSADLLGMLKTKGIKVAKKKSKRNKKKK
jgi:type II secretory pathway component PulF